MIFKCPFCKRELSYSAIGHIYKCKEKPNDLTKDDIKEIYYKFNYGDDIFENIIRDYNTEDTFVSDIPFTNINNVSCMVKTHIHI